MGGSNISHAAKAADQVEEPEAGRMVQSQIINLVNGVVTRSLAAADATSDRVGACGAKLHERVLGEHQWQAGLQLPFRFALNAPTPLELGKRVCFFHERVCQQAVGRLLRN
jgi:hypothetical protein